MIDFAPLFEELRTKTAYVLTEVTPAQGGGGIYEAQEIERRSFERLPGLPYVVLEATDPETTDRLLSVEGHEFTVKVHYVAREREGVGGEPHVRSRLTTLARALFATDPVSYDLMDITGYQFGADHPLNDVFIVKGMPLVAGCVHLLVVLSGTS